MAHTGTHPTNMPHFNLLALVIVYVVEQQLLKVGKHTENIQSFIADAHTGTHPQYDSLESTGSWHTHNDSLELHYTRERQQSGSGVCIWALHNME